MSKIPKSVYEQTQFRHGNASVKNPPVAPFAMELKAQGRGQETNAISNSNYAQ